MDKFLKWNIHPYSNSKTPQEDYSKLQSNVQCSKEQSEKAVDLSKMPWTVFWTAGVIPE